MANVTAVTDDTFESLVIRADKPVLVDYWADWCAPCRHEMPALDRLQQTLGGEKFEVVAVNIDTRNPDRAATWRSTTALS